MIEGFEEIMTHQETAKYLTIGKSLSYKMGKGRKNPAVKIANQWRFIKEDIDRWLQEIRNKEIVSNKEK
ncbi:helix-turn-helix domain-containing protein [Hippea maritima]|uniref:Helix-turn-helix domain-containing protein n=1 Tax=Hippea maritima (strain ATCC 700847 / DSM 10411 / MH2) TaxID=760142 RepID=F2LTX7_HIPMA|nr:helix-turn-helix domain-containing protein [Hippea maritima]AEA33376.1 hypothetical protein Hipma_0404 [Hippea maritima DSM 10411]